jgi:hypothetical protein
MEKILEVWADTGEEILRDLTEEELAQREADRVAFEAAEAERVAAEAEKSAKRAELLERLGLTEEEAKVLLG